MRTRVNPRPRSDPRSWRQSATSCAGCIPESLPKGCRNGLQRFCAGWTSQPARGRLGDAHTSKQKSDLPSTASAECDKRIVVANVWPARVKLACSSTQAMAECGPTPNLGEAHLSSRYRGFRASSTGAGTGEDDPFRPLALQNCARSNPQCLGSGPQIKRWRGVEANQLSEKGFPLLLRARQAIAAVIEAGTTSTDNMIEVVKNTP
jgi:hypothetical protein